MTTLYDSVSASAIPTTAQVVAGYVDGLYRWSDADWARFANAQKVRIAVFPSTNDGFVLDVEDGDATPSEAPGWVKMRRAAGVTNATIYCSRSVVPSVLAAFDAQGVARPLIWDADWTGAPHLNPGSVATQYANPPSSGGDFDLSMTDGTWPATTPPIPPAPHPDGPTTLQTGQKLEEGQTLVNGAYFAELQTDGNFVVYKEPATPLWSTQTSHSSMHPGPFFLEVQGDGNLVLYDKNSKPVWATSTKGLDPFLVMQGDGNLVLYATTPTWASGT